MSSETNDRYLGGQVRARVNDILTRRDDLHAAFGHSSPSDRVCLRAIAGESTPWHAALPTVTLLNLL